MLNNYKVCSKTSASSYRRVGKCKKQIPKVNQLSNTQVEVEGEVEQVPQKKMMKSGKNGVMTQTLKQGRRRNRRRKRK